MAKTIMISNQKGGVGKTTTALELCTMLTRQGKKVLALDTDGQCDLSTYSNAKLKWDYNIMDCLIYLKNIALEAEGDDEEIVLDSKFETFDLSHAIQTVSEGFDIIVSTPKLAEADAEFSKPEDVYLLKDLIDEVAEQYDYIIIDCAPARTRILYMTYFAADYCILLTESDDGSIRGIHRVITDVKLLYRRKMSNVKIIGTLLSKDEGTKAHTEAYETLCGIGEETGVYPFETTIWKGIAATESKNKQMSIHKYFDTCQKKDEKKKAFALTQSYDELLKEIIDRMGEH